MNAIMETTLGQLCAAYGVETPSDPEILVMIWKGEDGTVHEGWHITTTPELELLDEQWAPSGDAHAEEVARLLGA